MYKNQKRRVQLSSVNKFSDASIEQIKERNKARLEKMLEFKLDKPKEKKATKTEPIVGILSPQGETIKCIKCKREYYPHERFVAIPLRFTPKDQITCTRCYARENYKKDKYNNREVVVTFSDGTQNDQSLMLNYHEFVIRFIGKEEERLKLYQWFKQEAGKTNSREKLVPMFKPSKGALVMFPKATGGHGWKVSIKETHQQPKLNSDEVIGKYHPSLFAKRKDYY